MKSIDRKYRRMGFEYLCGIDEAGRGPLAGPVFCAAVILPEYHGIRGINDSKQLTQKKRAALYDQIISKAIAYSIVSVSSSEIDRINILEAAKQGMRQAVKSLSVVPDFLLIDALNLNIPEIAQVNLIKGDCRSESIAAASILAKVSRDRYMEKMHEEYPHYNFVQNKGYGTREHQAALQIHGPCQLHRFSFAPVSGLLKEEVVVST